MRKFKNNDKGVSTVVGYLFSLAVASMVMVSSIIITNNVIDEKKSQVATIEAQRIANYVSNAITEAVVAKQSMPEADYHRKLELPSTIGGMSYGIDVTDSTVSVVSSGGRVLATSSTYNANELGVDIVNNIVYGSDIEISSEGSQFVRTYDFGAGDSFSHSPVGAGSFRVDTYRLGSPSVVGQPLWQDANSPNRLPIVVENPSDHNIEGATVKIVLNTSNFDYDNVTVIPQSKTDGSSSGGAGGAGSKKTEGGSSDGDVIFADQFNSDMKIYEYAELPSSGPLGDLIATATYPSPWYRHWELGVGEDVYTYGGVKIRDRDNISFTISVDGGSCPKNKVIWNSITLEAASGYCVKCYKYNSSTGEAYFDRTELINEFTRRYGYPGDGSTLSFDLSGYVANYPNAGDVKKFVYSSSVQIKYGDIYVYSDDGLDEIQQAINDAPSGSTIYIYKSDTTPYSFWDSLTIEVNKPVILVGEYADKNDAPSTSISGRFKANHIIKIGPGGNGARLIMLTFFNGGECWAGCETCPCTEDNCDGLLLDGCSNVVVSRCYFRDNNGHGIKITNANNNVITNCKSYNNLGYLGNSRTGNGLLIDGSGSYRNCIMDSHFYGQSGSNSEGILLDNGAHSNTIIRCNVYWQFGADGDGIVLEDGVHDNRIIYCEIYDNYNYHGDGIEISSSDSSSSPTMNNEILYCNISGHNGESADGIEISSPRGGGDWCPDCHKAPKFINITGCKIYDNGQYGGVTSGIYLYYVTDINITDCEIYSIYGTGIWLKMAARNSIKDCSIHDISGPIDEDALNIGYGDGIVFFDNCLQNRIENCDISYNTNDGIHIKESSLFHAPTQFSSRENIITKCRVHDSISGVGINFTNTIRNTISQCDIYRNYMDGILMEGGDPDIGSLWSSYTPPDPGNEVTYCNIFANGDDGIHLWGNVGILSRLSWTRINHCNLYSNGMPLGGQDKAGSGIGIMWGVWDSRPFYTSISQNNFLHTITSGVNPDFSAYDSTDYGMHNYWDTTTEGNYWCDLQSSTYGWPRYIHPEGTADVCTPFSRGSYRWVGEFGRYKIDTRGGSGLVDCGYWNDGWDDDHPRGPGHDDATRRDPFPNPTTVIVEPSGTPTSPCPYIITNNIKDAISKTIAGGTIYVEYGTYEITSRIKIDRSLSLIGIPDPVTGDYPTIKFSPTELIIAPPILIDVTKKNSSTIFIENLTLDGVRGANPFTYRGINVGLSNPTGPGDVIISNCIIKNINKNSGIYNGEGIYINSNCGVSVKNCIFENNICGINQTANNGKITDCSFYQNIEYDVYLTGSSNTIYHNYFGNTIQNKNAKNLGSNNLWDNGYPSGGNRWEAYDGYDDGARDIKNGNPQTLIGGDGIADIKYAIEGGGWDYFPFGGTVSDEDAIPPPSPVTQKLFAIDYWNPYGESVLLVKLSIGAGEKQKLYLYYGGGKNNFETDSIGNVAEFYDTFDSTLSSTKWYVEGSPEISSDGILDLKKLEGGGKGPSPPAPQYILSKWPIPPVNPPSPPGPTDAYNHTVNEELYLVEASVKLNESYSNNQQANLILLCQDNGDYNKAYLTTINASTDLSINNLFIHKRKNEVSQEEINLKSVNLPNSLDDWIRIKSYVYISDNTYKTPAGTTKTVIADINNTVYDFVSFSEFNSSSYTDGYNINSFGIRTEIPGYPDTDDPYFGGMIGIGCGLLTDPNNPTISKGSVLVDWIRVLKTPLAAPKITVGAPEGKDYYWATPNTMYTSDSNPSGSPSSPGPLLRDYHYSSVDNWFIVNGLEGNAEGVGYRISITKGNGSMDSLPGMNVEIGQMEQGDYHYLGTVPHFGSTSKQQYETESIIITKTNNNDALVIKFSATTLSGGSAHGLGQWTVNSIVIERIENGIMIK